jgi:hypothetical protein
LRNEKDILVTSEVDKRETFGARREREREREKETKGGKWREKGVQEKDKQSWTRDKKTKFQGLAYALPWNPCGGNRSIEGGTGMSKEIVEKKERDWGKCKQVMRLSK